MILKNPPQSRHLNLLKTLFPFLFIFLALQFQSSIVESSDKYGGHLVLSTVSDPKSFNDIIAKETSTTLVTNLIFEGLTRTNAVTTKVEPNLAESWEVNKDGLEWIFHIRRDVYWNDGEPFKADDVVFTFNDLIYNDEIPSSAQDIYTIDGKIFNVEKIDDHTVKFTLPTKFAPFLRGMNQPILPKHKLNKSLQEGKFNFTWGIDTDPKEIVGTGAYKLIRYSPGQRLVFAKNDYYWKKSDLGEKLPFIEKITYLIVQNADIQLLKFMEGTLDYYSLRGMDYPLVKPLESEKNFVVYNLGPAFGSNFITFNLNTRNHPETGVPFVDSVKQKWFNNIQFRRAVAHAIDKEKIITIVKNGLGYDQFSPVSQASSFFHNPNVTKYDYDLEKAKGILAKAGFLDRDEDGFIEDDEGNKVEFTLNTNTSSTERVDIAAIIRYDLEKIGMKVNYQPLEFNTLVKRLTSLYNWDSIVLGLTGGIEPHFGKNVWTSAGHLHLWNPQQEFPATKWEKSIDNLFSKGVQELDEDRRKDYYDEFQMIVSHHLPVIYTVLSSNISAVRNKFGNLNPTNYGGVFHNLEEIYIKQEYR